MKSIIITEPQDIERKSFAIISEILGEKQFPLDQQGIIKRVIHTSADFDYAENLIFSKDAVQSGIAALKRACTVYTDTNMAYAGINQKNLDKFHARKACYIAAPEIAALAAAKKTTRAVQAMTYAAKQGGEKIFAVGNAPTALITLYDMIKAGELKPGLVVGVPVGFVNVVESKEMFMELNTPYIIAKGRKGGSNIAAAIINALLLEALK